MQTDDGPRWNPSLFGPLTMEPEMVTGPSRFFPGEDRFLSDKKLAERERLWEALAPLLDRVLDRDETVLYMVPAVHVPPFLHLFGFGVWWALFFKAALVVTDRRLVEVLSPDWKRAGTRISSYTWGQVQQLKLSMGTLSLKPAKGRRQQWKLPAKGDRKLLKLLVPKIQEQLPNDIHMPRQVPLWHCPECGAASSTHPKQCHQCQTIFKTQGRASALALAIPGGGLFYSGHPVLGTFDLFGEAIAFIMVAVLFLTAGTPVEIGIAAVVGIVILAITKLESIHLSTILVKRTIQEPHTRGWRVAAIFGAIASLVLIALPPLFSGVFANRLDADLDFSGNTSGWTGGLDPTQWQHGADEDQRSEWVRNDGQALFVFSIPRSEAETIDALDAAIRAEGQQTEQTTFAGFECLRSVAEYEDEDGEATLLVRWFLFDREHDDIHIVSASVWPGDLELLEPDVEELVRSATWRPISEP